MLCVSASTDCASLLRCHAISADTPKKERVKGNKGSRSCKERLTKLIAEGKKNLSTTLNVEASGDDASLNTKVDIANLSFSNSLNSSSTYRSTGAALGYFVGEQTDDCKQEIFSVQNENGTVDNTVHFNYADNVAALKCKSSSIEEYEVPHRLSNLALKTYVEHMKPEMKQQQTNVTNYISKIPTELKGNEESNCFTNKDFLQYDIESNHRLAVKSGSLNVGNIVKHQCGVAGNVSVRLTSETLRILESETNSAAPPIVKLDTILQASTQATSSTDSVLTKQHDITCTHKTRLHSPHAEDFFWKVKRKADEIRRSEGKKLQCAAHYKAEKRFQHVKAKVKKREKEWHVTGNKNYVHSDLSDDGSSSGSSGDSTHGLVNASNDVSGINMCENPSDLWYGLKTQNGKPVEVHQINPRRNKHRKINRKLTKPKERSVGLNCTWKPQIMNKTKYMKFKRGERRGKTEVEDRRSKRKAECEKLYNKNFKIMHTQSKVPFYKCWKPCHTEIFSKPHGESLRTVYFSNLNSNLLKPAATGLVPHGENSAKEMSSSICMQPMNQLRQKTSCNVNFEFLNFKLAALVPYNRVNKSDNVVPSTTVGSQASAMKFLDDSAGTVGKQREIVSYIDLEGCEAVCSSFSLNEKSQQRINSGSNANVWQATTRNTSNEYVQLRRRPRDDRKHFGSIKKCRKTNKNESKSFRVQRLLAERRGLIDKANVAT